MVAIIIKVHMCMGLYKKSIISLWGGWGLLSGGHPFVVTQLCWNQIQKFNMQVFCGFM